MLLLFYIPAVQRFIASEVEEVLSETLGTKVRVERVGISVPNRIVIDGFQLRDQRDRHLFDSKRLAARLDILPLFEGRISISSVQLFGLDAHIIKDYEHADFNFQFVIDSLKSDDDEPSSPLDLRIASIVIRNSKVSYDRYDLAPNHNVFDSNHLHLSHVSGHVMLPTLTDDELRLKVKNLSLREDNSGLQLRNLTTSLVVKGKDIEATDFNLLTEYSQLAFERLTVSLADSTLKSFSTSGIHGYVNTLDVGRFVPALAETDVRVDYSILPEYKDSIFRVSSLTLSSGHDLDVLVQGHYNLKGRAWNADIRKFSVNTTLTDKVLEALHLNDVCQYTTALKHISYEAKMNGADEKATLDGTLRTGLGDLKHHAAYDHGKLTANLSTELMRLSQMTALAPLGDLSLKADMSMNIHNGDAMRLGNVALSASMPLLTLNGYPCHDISLNIVPDGRSSALSLRVNDANADGEVLLNTGDIATLINGDKGAFPLSGTIDIRHLRPSVLGVKEKLLSDAFSLHASADISDVKAPLKGMFLNINDIAKYTEEEHYTIGDIEAVCNEGEDNMKTLSVHSPFLTADVRGRFSFATLQQSFINLVASQLSQLNFLPQYSRQDNSIDFNLQLRDAEPLRQFLGLDLSCPEDVRLRGSLDDATRMAEVEFSAPNIIYNNVSYHDARALVFTRNDTLHLSANIEKLDEEGRALILNAQGEARNNTINSILSFNNGRERLLAGELSTSVHLMQDPDGKLMASADIYSSHVMTGDTLWTVKPSKVYYSDKNIRVDGFAIEHNNQNIRIDGVASDSPDDSLVVSLRDVNVQYILDFVNFHSVEFAGYASGTAVARSLFGERPEAVADLRVREFTFCEGPMGTLLAHAAWNNDEENILIDAMCTEDDVMTTKIDGFISPTHEQLHLDIDAIDTPVDFMGGICKNFLKDVSGRCQGKVFVGGPLSEIQLTGMGRFSAKTTFPALNTTYEFRNQDIVMTPGEIRFPNDTIYDVNGNQAYVDGAITHTFLGTWCYDLNIDAHHFLCYDFPTMTDGSTFCGKAIGTGTCRIHGRPGEIVFDIDALPEKGSMITYDVSSPESLANQDFITWGHVEEDTLAEESSGIVVNTSGHNGDGSADDDFHSNLTLNMLVHCTPDATLRLLMDASAGDDILLHGRGTLRASYHNKRGMQIFGNYQVDGGVYNMTIRNIIKKEFTFLPEGGIAFNGAPFDAKVNLKAQYVLNSVPLSDLRIGKTFSNNGVRVNCLMNIGGVASDPQVEFALELPQASTDIQQMVKSIIDSQNEMNQQVVYLLAIGRFYNDSEANAQDGEVSRTTLAMQSFISGTLSQQVSKAISNFMNINNWNFATNVAPGDEGWNNAEYEGMLSGKLLNDRLLINGQFGYRDNPNATSSFIGDFDVRYLLTPNGNMSVRVYNQTTDRYFSRNTLNTQGLGIVLKHDFTSLRDLFRRKRKTGK